jgi:hypothetical protein
MNPNPNLSRLVLNPVEDRLSVLGRLLPPDVFGLIFSIFPTHHLNAATTNKCADTKMKPLGARMRAQSSVRGSSCAPALVQRGRLTQRSASGRRWNLSLRFTGLSSVDY